MSPWIGPGRTIATSMTRSIKSAWLDPRQHRHFARGSRSGKVPSVFGLADHRIGFGVLGGDGREIECDALVLGKQIKAAFHAGEHAEAPGNRPS